MRRLACIAGLAAGLAGWAAPSTARAEVVDADQPAIIGALLAGTLGGITTSIAAIVYSVRGRSFHTPWVAVSMFSCAITGSFTASLIVDTANEGFGIWRVIGIISMLTLTAWPGSFVVRSALTEAEPGELFEPDLAWRPAPARDPIRALDRRAPRRAVLFPAFAMSF